jgi:hypothetical protein
MRGATRLTPRGDAFIPKTDHDLEHDRPTQQFGHIYKILYGLVRYAR